MGHVDLFKHGTTVALVSSTALCQQAADPKQRASGHTGA